MAKENVEGASGNSQEGSGTGPTEEPVDGQQLSPPNDAFSDQQIEVLETLLDRKLQGFKDRRIQSQQDQIDELREIIEDYAKYTGSPVDENAIRSMQVDQLVRERQSQQNQATSPRSQASGTERSAPQSVDFKSMFQNAGVDANDPDALILAGRHEDNPQRLAFELLQLKARRNKSAPGNAATLAAPVGGVIAPSNDDEKANQLLAEYRQLQTNPTQNFKRLGEIKKELAVLSQ